MNRKNSSQIARWCKRVSYGLLLFGSSLAGRAQFVSTPNYIIDQFDTDTTGFYENQGWGSTDPTLAWVTTNATPVAGEPNNPGSGSMQWQDSWAVSGDQIMVDRNFNTINPVGDTLNFDNYTNLSFDIKFLPDSATNASGNYVTILLEAIPSSDGWPSTDIGGYTASATNGNSWIHVSVPLPQGVAKLTSVTGFGIKLQEGNSDESIGQATDFLIDNIVLGGNSIPPPPPTLSISGLPSPPLGLAIVAPGGGNQYNRTMLEAQDPVYGLNFSWVTASTPVSYSFTVAGYPGTNYAGFQSQIFLVPNGGSDDPSIDYDAANVAEFVLGNNANGSATAFFTWKTNDAEDNSGFNTNILATITNSTGAAGTWTVTFNNDTNVTITGPGGISASGNFPSEAAAQVFVNPLSLYFGNEQGGSTANIGQYSTYSSFVTTGTPISDPIDDVFTNDNGVINTSQWSLDVNSGAENNIFIIQSGGYWLYWTQPDSGYVPFTSPTLGSGAVWTSAGITNFVHTSTWDGTLLPQSALPGAQQGYIRLGM